MERSILTFLSFSCLLLSASAFSSPKIGDLAYMEGTLVDAGESVKVTTTQEIISYVVNTAVYTIRQTQSVGLNSQTKDENVSADDLMSEETATQIVGACESAGIGAAEKIQVKAGTFDSCKLKSNSGSTVWIAAVPFGVVRLQTRVSDGFVDIALYSYSRGAK